jgi:hypothetical protein
MAKFSERIGLKPPKSIIQKDSIDSELENALWNGLVIFYWKKFDAEWYNSSKSHIKTLWLQIWVNYFKNRLDELEEYKPNFILQVKNYFFKCEWYQVYELIEFIYCSYKPEFYEETSNLFSSYCNSVLERELSGYRFINGNFVPITSDEEISSIETALNVTDTFQPVKAHLNRAVQHLSNKQTPDYRNSIKESISAVESLCAIITKDPKATLGQALKTIEKNHDLHPALKSSFSSLYGYTSDADGIRHKLLDDDNLKQEDAIYMLVSCSAFTNYLIKKSAS